MRARIVMILVLCAGRAAPHENVTVVSKTLAMEQEHTLLVDRSLEYVLQFVPNSEQSVFPTRLWVWTDAAGGDVTRPLLLTARQRTGATTWQLPYRAGDALLYEIQRTLCPFDSAHSADSADSAAEPSHCADEAGEGEESLRGQFTLHVSSSCAGAATVRLRAAPARDWLLAAHRPAHVTATPAAPRVTRYQFLAGQDSVRLVVASPDDLCATVAVQPYDCPIAQTVDEIGGSTLRMTIERSGGTHLSKVRFPRGFYVTVAVHPTDAACSAQEEEPSDWLWEAAFAPPAPRARLPPRRPARTKQLTIEIKESLTRAEYLVASVATLVLFLSFYAVFAALVLLQRWEPWHRLVAPRAVLADPSRTEAGHGGVGGSPAGARGPRPRRDSAATFDGSDNSDTDSQEGEVTDGTATTAALTPPGGRSPDVTSPHARPDLAPDVTSPHARPDLASDVTSPGAPADIAPEAAPPANGTALAEGAGLEADASRGTDGQEQAEAAARPFGLPARLRVAALARRRARVLEARSQRYLYTLCTVAVFYALPVLQLVTAFQLILNTSGSLDLCYYNFLCAHPVGALSDFNHVWSNLGYLALGVLFMVQLRRRRLRRRASPRDEEYGIPTHYGLLSSLGAGMVVVALLSASYHVCPNRLNFQFDTAFMYVLAVVCMVNIYQSRHPDINARAHSTFAVLAVLIALVVWGVLGGGPLFWSLFTVLHVFTFLLLSLRIYYVGQFRLEKGSLAEAARALRSPPAPLYRARLAALLAANAVNWAWALYGLAAQPANIASHLLFVLLCNALLHIVFYLSMKLLHGERPRWYAWAFLGGAAACWAPALYLFAAGASDWAAPAARSRLLNHECRALRFYDSHDLWHALSALALYLTFNAMLTWDDGLAAVKRTDIAVF